MAQEKESDPKCTHPNSVKEYNLGADSGDRICTVCKEVFNPRDRRQERL